MATYDSEVLEVNTLLVIQPYQFEPLRTENNAVEAVNSSSEGSDIDDLLVPTRRLNTEWCDCGNCEAMPTEDECICCSDISAVDVNKQPEDLQCITEHQIFTANCLDRNVIYVSMFEYLEHVGPMDDNEPIHEKYRYIAYRRFVQWIWHRLGKHNRKILPACVVSKIRKAFPSEQYTGFKYATE